MKVLVNASTCVVGGGAQVAASYIYGTLFEPRHSYSYVISSMVASHLRGMGVDISEMTILSASPAPSNLKNGQKMRDIVIMRSNYFSPDIVFTIFGPSYIRFNCLHLCGYARPWDVTPNIFAFRELGLVGSLLMLLSSFARLSRLGRSDFYWVETSQVKAGLSRFARIPPNRIAVIPNSLSPVFDNNAPRSIVEPVSSGSTIRILCLSAPYAHKRLPFVVDVAAYLAACSAEEFKFVLSVDPGTSSASVRRLMNNIRRLQLTDLFEFAGTVPACDLPEMYSSCTLLFLPTVLECFSVTFLEAMFMGRPIVTSRLPSIQAICGDAALYFHPSSVEEAANQIQALVSSPSLYHDLVNRGHKRLKKFPDQRQKFALHTQLLESICASRNRP